MWELVVPAVASLVGGLFSGSGQDAAGKEQSKASQQQLALVEGQYKDQRNLQRPNYLTSGNAMNMLAAQYGLPAQDYGAAYGAGASGNDQQWSSYLAANPDLQQEWSRLQTQSKNPFTSAEQYAQWHWQNNGQQEGRTLPAMQAGAGAPGGSGANPLASFWNSPQGEIATKGFLGVDAPEVQGAFASGGKALSGSATKALYDRGQARASTGYNNYLSGLGNLAGLNSTTLNQMGNASSNYSSGSSNALANLGNAKGNAATGAYNGLASGISGALGAVNDYGKKNWGWG